MMFSPKLPRRPKTSILSRKYTVYRLASARHALQVRIQEEEMTPKQPKLVAPRGACDTHLHFYDPSVPCAPGTFPPGDFSVEMYRAMQRRLGLERVIVVQPNAYT